jgi:hypothetical protein
MVHVLKFNPGGKKISLSNYQISGATISPPSMNFFLR